MTESQNSTPEMQNKDVTSRPPNKHKGSALDRGFPTGFVLIVLVILIIVLQGISAWKVMNLDSERTDLEKREALFEKEKKDYEHLKIELPSLRSERDELNAKIPGIKGIVADLKRSRANLLKEKAQAETIIAKTKKAEEIHAALQQSVDSFRKEVENKTEEIKRLSGPNSQLQKRVNDFDMVVKRLDKEPKRLDNAIDQAKMKIEDTLGTVNRAADSLQSEVNAFSISTKSNMAMLQNVLGTTKAVIGKVKSAEKKLSQGTDSLSMSSIKLETQIGGIGNNLADLQKNNQKFSSQTVEFARIISNTSSTADGLKILYDDADRSFKKFSASATSLDGVIRDIKSNNATIKNAIGKIQTAESCLDKQAISISNSANQLQSEINNFKTVIAGFQTKNQEFSNDTTKISTTATNLSNVFAEVQRLSSGPGNSFQSLKASIASLDSVISDLTSNSSRIRNASNAMVKKTNELDANVKKISQKMDKTEQDASSFSKKIEAFDPSAIEDITQQHESNMNSVMEKISFETNSLSNLSRNVEEMLKQLLNEIDSLNKLVKKRQNEMKEGIKEPSPKKFN